MICLVMCIWSHGRLGSSCCALSQVPQPPLRRPFSSCRCDPTLWWHSKESIFRAYWLQIFSDIDLWWLMNWHQTNNANRFWFCMFEIYLKHFVYAVNSASLVTSPGNGEVHFSQRAMVETPGGDHWRPKGRPRKPPGVAKVSQSLGGGALLFIWHIWHVYDMCMTCVWHVYDISGNLSVTYHSNDSWWMLMVSDDVWNMFDSFLIPLLGWFCCPCSRHGLRCRPATIQVDGSRWPGAKSVPKIKQITNIKKI